MPSAKKRLPVPGAPNVKSSKEEGQLVVRLGWDIKRPGEVTTRELRGWDIYSRHAEESNGGWKQTMDPTGGWVRRDGGTSGGLQQHAMVRGLLPGKSYQFHIRPIGPDGEACWT